MKLTKKSVKRFKIPLPVFEKPKKKLKEKKIKGKKVKTRSQLKKLADKLFSLLIRQRGACEMCGSKKNLQVAHVISRSNLHLRFACDNALCLCKGCHMFKWHKEPLSSLLWFEGVYPKEYKYLLKEKDTIEPNMDYGKIIISLKKSLTIGEKCGKK